MRKLITGLLITVMLLQIICPIQVNAKSIYNETVRDSLLSVDEYTVISPRVSSVDKSRLSESEIKTKYLGIYNMSKSYQYVCANIDSLMEQVLAHSKMSYSWYTSDYLIGNKTQIMRGLVYLHHYYGFAVNERAAMDILLYDTSAIGSAQVDALDLVIRIGSYSGDWLRAVQAPNLYQAAIGGSIGIATLPSLIEKLAALEKTDAATFLTQKSKAVFAQSGSGSSLWDKCRQEEALQRLILPLLNLSESSIYVANTSDTVTIGLTAAYGGAEETGNLVGAVVQQQQAFLDALRRISSTGTNLDRYPSVVVIDSLARKAQPGESKRLRWSAEYGDSADIGVRELITPCYYYAAYSMLGAQAAVSGGSAAIRYYADDALSEAGVTAYTHEMTHIFDETVWLNDRGRRNGAQAEAYATGLLESVDNTQPADGGHSQFGPIFSLNTSFELGDNRIQNRSPQRFQSADDVGEYMRGVMNVLNTLDVLEAEEILKLPDADKAVLFNKIELTDDNRIRIRNITEAEAAMLQTVGDLVDRDIVSGRLVVHGNSTVQTLDNNQYDTVPMFEGVYAALHRADGYAGDFLFKRYAWELLGSAGWENGLIKWASGEFKSDGEAFSAILPAYRGNYAQYKKEMYEGCSKNAAYLAEVKSYQDVNEMRAAIAKALQQDLTGMKTAVNQGTYSYQVRAVREVKQKIYREYLLGTDDFKTSIYTIDPGNTESEEERKRKEEERIEAAKIASEVQRAERGDTFGRQLDEVIDLDRHTAVLHVAATDTEDAIKLEDPDDVIERAVPNVWYLTKSYDTWNMITEAAAAEEDVLHASAVVQNDANGTIHVKAGQDLNKIEQTTTIRAYDFSMELELKEGKGTAIWKPALYINLQTRLPRAVVSAPGGRTNSNLNYDFDTVRASDEAGTETESQKIRRDLFDLQTMEGVPLTRAEITQDTAAAERGLLLFARKPQEGRIVFDLLTADDSENAIGRYRYGITPYIKNPDGTEQELAATTVTVAVNKKTASVKLDQNRVTISRAATGEAGLVRIAVAPSVPGLMIIGSSAEVVRTPDRGRNQDGMPEEDSVHADDLLIMIDASGYVTGNTITVGVNEEAPMLPLGEYAVELTTWTIEKDGVPVDPYRNRIYITVTE